MNYLATADTDIGISKEINQDSILVKHADSEMGEIVLAVVCDGMGGLSKGELASATVIRQLTVDQTFVEREVSRGVLTLEQAKTDRRRNMLLQCVGASEKVEPDILVGACEKGVYMLCTDGFRHEISETEMYESLNPRCLVNKETMHKNVKFLIEQNKHRREKDNISVILIKAG